MNTETPCRHCGERYHGHDLFAGQHPYEPSPNLHKTPDTYTPPEQTYTPTTKVVLSPRPHPKSEIGFQGHRAVGIYLDEFEPETPDKFPTAAEMLQAANESSAVQQKVIDEYNELDTILQEQFVDRYHLELSSVYPAEQALAEARARLLQYIEGIIGEDEQNQELDNYGEVWTETRNAFKAEQRQKLRGENKENNHV